MISGNTRLICETKDGEILLKEIEIFRVIVIKIGFDNNHE